jgi:hypothetical protein
MLDDKMALCGIGVISISIQEKYECVKNKTELKKMELFKFN